MNNPNFYPTPKKLINKMFSRIKNGGDLNTILEPSAGNGALIEAYKEKYYFRNTQISAIEIDPELRATLIGKKINVIDSDFLQYEGIDKFDLILANFPFSDGEHHLNKALDIMFNGQIVCLVNAETIKNPYSNTRKELLRRLDKLGASIEFLEGEFLTSETKRKTNVEVALISVEVKQDIEELFSQGLKEDNKIFNEKIEADTDLNHHNQVQAIVARYRNEKEILTSQIFEFYRNYDKVSRYIGLTIAGEEPRYSDGDRDLTAIMQDKVNQVSQTLKKNYWVETLSLQEVKSRLTSKNKDKVLSTIENYSKMEFSESNIREFITSIIHSYPKMVNDSIMDLFDSITSYAMRDSRWDKEYEANIHYFNAWKTNEGFKVNQKIILPFYRPYSSGMPILAHKAESFVEDMEKVMSYFMGKRSESKIRETITNALNRGETKNIDTEFFAFTFYKKGTVHIKFKDEELLRRFNIEACKLKNWLPMDYATKEQSDLSKEEKEVVEKFEGLKSYEKISTVGFGQISSSVLKIEFNKAG